MQELYNMHSLLVNNIKESVLIEFTRGIESISCY